MFGKSAQKRRGFSKRNCRKFHKGSLGTILWAAMDGRLLVDFGQASQKNNKNGFRKAFRKPFFALMGKFILKCYKKWKYSTFYSAVRRIAFRMRRADVQSTAAAIKSSGFFSKMEIAPCGHTARQCWHLQHPHQPKRSNSFICG